MADFWPFEGLECFLTRGFLNEGPLGLQSGEFSTIQGAFASTISEAPLLYFCNRIVGLSKIQKMHFDNFAHPIQIDNFAPWWSKRLPWWSKDDPGGLKDYPGGQKITLVVKKITLVV